MFGWLLNRLEKVDIVGEDGTLYLRRYHLIKTNFLRLYIHQIMRSDDDRALHDHPWSFVSFIMKGQYTEITPETGEKGRLFKRFSIIRHKAEDAHRLVLEAPVWTLVWMGGKTREWGFITEKGWVHWKEYLDEKFGASRRKDDEVAQATKYME